MRLRIMVLLSFIASICAGTVGLSGSAAAAPFARLQGDAVRSGNDLIQKVHGRHCRTRYGAQRHWHGGRGHVHRRWHRHGRCYSYRRRYYRPAYRVYYRRYYARPRFYGYRRYGYRRFYRSRYRRGVSIRLHF